MMAAILNSAKLDSDTAILNSDTLLSSLRFTQKHSHSTLTLTPTNSIWLKVIHSHLTWWWQPSCILPSWFLPSWIQPFCSKLWLQLIQSDSKSFILTQLDDGGHLGFSHFPQKNFTQSFSLNLMMEAILNLSMLDSDTAILDSNTLLSSLRFTQKHSSSTLILTQTNSIWLKLINSDLNWWWQPSCILPSWILISWIQPFCSKLWLQLIQSDSKSFILTQLDDGGHLGFSHFPQKSFTHSFSLNLMMAAILNSAMLDSDTAILDSNTLLSSPRFTQKHSSSTMILTQNNSMWLT